jgi:uncharacterized protein (DUF3084 family)
MNLKTFYSKLKELEEGDELKSFIEAQLSSRDKEINTLQSSLSNADTQLDNLAQSLNTDKENLQEKAKELSNTSQNVTKERDELQQKLEQEQQKREEADQNYKQLEKSAHLESFSREVGANPEVLKDMATDLELYTKEGKGYAKDSEGNEKEFKEYVQNDPKLKNYEAAIFGQPAPSLPSGKGSQEDAAADPVADAVKSFHSRRQKATAERVAKRFGK